MGRGQGEGSAQVTMLHRGSVQEGLGEGAIGSRGLAVEEHWVSPPPRWEGSGGLQRGWEAAADHQFFLQDVGIQFAEAWGWNPGNDLQISMDPQLPPRAGLAELGLSAYEVTRYINDAHPIVIEPAQVAALPDWDSGEEARAFAAELRLPFDKTYLDLTDGRGQASLLSVDSPDIAFEDGSRAYPDTVSLEGALCYEFEGNGGSGVAIHPLLGSPQERYLFEVSDRFMFPRVILTDTERMPDPMPGTILLNLDDGVTHVPWPDHDMCPSHLHAQWSLVAVSRALACFYLSTHLPWRSANRP